MVLVKLPPTLSVTSPWNPRLGMERTCPGGTARKQCSQRCGHPSVLPAPAGSGALIWDL